jgi:hypothetical protein
MSSLKEISAKLKAEKKSPKEGRLKRMSEILNKGLLVEFEMPKDYGGMSAENIEYISIEILNKKENGSEK